MRDNLAKHAVRVHVTKHTRHVHLHQQTITWPAVWQNHVLRTVLRTRHRLVAILRPVPVMDRSLNMAVSCLAVHHRAVQRLHVVPVHQEPVHIINMPVAQ